MEDHYQKLRSLKAGVKMDKFNSQLGEHDLMEGNVTFVPQKGRDAIFRIDWKRPQQESLSVVNKQYVMYRWGSSQAIGGKVSDIKGSGKGGSAMAFLNMSKSQLQANYTINYLGQEKVEGGTLTWHLELIPKTAASYRKADLWIDGNGMPIQARITEKNNDTTTILLSGLQKNVTVKSKDIPIQLPKGTRLIEG
jgi:outer membrane lipoprotein-sorting protein